MHRWINQHFKTFTIAPTIVIMLIVFGLPMAFSLLLATQSWNIHGGLFTGHFVGVRNFADLLQDEHFIRSALMTTGYTAVAVSLEVILGLGIALLLNMNLRFIGIFRAILVVPMMMTPIVAALCWKLMLDPNGGAINKIVDTQIVWLGNPAVALYAVGLVNVWQNSPYVAILLLAGLRSLPYEPMEAAMLDGANHWQRFWHITLPLLQPHLIVALLLRTIFEFRSFDNVYVMTSGGPADSTMLLSIFTYTISFVHFDLSLGAAASWIMLAMVFMACLALISILSRGRQK